MKLKTIKSVCTLFIFFSLSVTLFSQETTYYYGSNHKPITPEDAARFSKKVINKNKKAIIVESYSKIEKEWELTQTEKIKVVNEDQQVIIVKPISGNSYSIKRNFKKRKADDYEFADYIGGKLIRIGNTSRKTPLCLQDTVKEFYMDGKIKTIATYMDNQLKSNKNWLNDGKKYYDNIFYSVDEEPVYLLGQQQFNNFILANLIQKKVDLSHYTERIVLGWVISDSGELEGIHVAKSYYPGLSNLLVEIVNEMPSDWRPASLNGENVNYYMQFPINFKSQKDDGFESLELVDGVLSWD